MPPGPSPSEPAPTEPSPGDLPIDDLVLRLTQRGPATRYELEEEIARGGMGIIRRIFDPDLRRRLAMKVLPAPATRPAGEDAAFSRFLEEAQVTAQLEHPGIVPVHDVGVDAAGRLYFTMRLVHGDTFLDVIEWVRTGKPGWSLAHALGVLIDVCDAVAYAHSKGVVHRDLKPLNVMVGRFGETYVLDWGLAKVLGRPERHDLRLRAAAPAPSSRVQSERADAVHADADSPLVTMDGLVVGTPSYMPPEQAAGQLERIGPAGDVYAIGAMLYHLLAGHAPYVPTGARVSPHTVLAAVLQGPPPPLLGEDRDLPAELVAICEKAMARDLARRYADPGALAADLRSFLEDRVVRAYETGAVAEFRKWVRRNRGTATALATALFVIFGGIAAVALREKQVNARLDAARARAEASLEDVKRLADLRTLRELVARADRLWPAWPEQKRGLEQWLADAQSLVERLPLHRAGLAELARQAVPAAEEKRVADEQGHLHFADPQLAWWHETLAELIAGLERFTAPDPAVGTVANVEQRLARAGTIAHDSIEVHAEEWQQAIDEIAADARYGGLELVPQVGLVPIGSDPESGLFEFWQPESGTRPERQAATGRLEVAEASGLVFVLIPGGTFMMGARTTGQSEAAAAANLAAQERADELPVHEVALAPFFLSKYEMTQGQWMRVTGTNPSWFQSAANRAGTPTPLSSPVEMISHADADLLFFQLGLELPTEAQWEYAARAGTTTPWWFGSELHSIAGKANIGDRALVRGYPDETQIEGWLDDSFPATSPVGHFAANRFGLHDVAGNVAEWCRDAYTAGAYALPTRAGDGLRLIPGADHLHEHVMRGGTWRHPALLACSAYRTFTDVNSRVPEVGVRPARAIR